MNQNQLRHCTFLAESLGTEDNIDYILSISTTYTVSTSNDESHLLGIYPSKVAIQVPTYTPTTPLHILRLYLPPSHPALGSHARLESTRRAEMAGHSVTVIICSHSSKPQEMILLDVRLD